ncbi:acyl-CoA dehydrogenase [Chelatococcus reniformis]|uniref:Acyl-CoA dehydrogenase n=1 Tax=Chelatococcus reniformis TaxID=1494448 RepID=A0A916UJL0_9HYPH|nr:acyl-CoA dehydrogenase [Chelatococcus reniformis]
MQLFQLLIELGAAESNLPQSLRLHFHHVEHLMFRTEWTKQKFWLERVAQGDLFGNATTEPPDTPIGEIRTKVLPHGDGRYRLNGRKAYGTGSLYAQWIPVVAVDHQGERITVVVPADRIGVTLVDDWGGFGQRLTATGTSVFEDVVVDADEILGADKRITRVGGNFPQLVHLATLAGIAAAAARDVTDKVAARRRIYSTGSGDLARNDPIIQAEVGKINAVARAARSIVLGAAASLDDAWHRWKHDGAYAPTTDEAYVEADIAISSAQVVLVPLVLGAASQLFDALGASAIDAKGALDRHWRNARAVSSHNPYLYKARRVGGFHLNGTPPPIFVPGDDVGISPAAEAARSDAFPASAPWP